jgi:hypothetical protein
MLYKRSGLNEKLLRVAKKTNNASLLKGYKRGKRYSPVEKLWTRGLYENVRLDVELVRQVV